MGPFSKYPLPATRSYTPAEAPEEALRAMHKRIGVDRAVIIQSQGHGLDHSALLDALEVGDGRYKGVAVLSTESTSEQVARFHAAGICGVRLNFMKHLSGIQTYSEMSSIIALVKPFNWHIALHMTSSDIVEHHDFIKSIGLRVAIDHMGRPSLPEGVDSIGLTTLRQLLDTDTVWVKMSGVERLSRSGAPFSDAFAIARSLAEHAPDRLLWGTDWPHVNLHGPMPNDGDLADFVSIIAPTPTLRRKLLIDNPNQFFDFEGIIPT